MVLAGCSGGGAAPGGASTAGAAAVATDPGGRLYDGNCIACHQADGHGVPGVYPSLAGSSVADGDVTALARWVIEGERPAALPEGRYATRMPQFGWLQPADAAALFTYVRSHFGNHAPAVAADAVAAALDKNR